MSASSDSLLHIVESPRHWTYFSFWLSLIDGTLRRRQHSYRWCNSLASTSKAPEYYHVMSFWRLTFSQRRNAHCILIYIPYEVMSDFIWSFWLYHLFHSYTMVSVRVGHRVYFLPSQWSHHLKGRDFPGRATTLNGEPEAARFRLVNSRITKWEKIKNSPFSVVSLMPREFFRS